MPIPTVSATQSDDCRSSFLPFVEAGQDKTVVGRDTRQQIVCAGDEQGCDGDFAAQPVVLQEEPPAAWRAVFPRLDPVPASRLFDDGPITCYRNSGERRHFTHHSQRTDALAPTLPHGVQQRNSEVLIETRDVSLPWLVDGPSNAEEYRCLGPPLVSHTISQRRLQASIGLGASIDLTSIFLSRAQLSGLSGNGDGVVAIMTNPTVVMVDVGLPMRTEPTIVVGARMGSLDVNAARAFVHRPSQRVVVFQATNDGCVIAQAIDLKTSSGNPQAVPCVVYSGKSELERVLEDQREAAATTTASSSAAAKNRYCSSMNDLAVWPSDGATRFTIFCPRDGDEAFVAEVLFDPSAPKTESGFRVSRRAFLQLACGLEGKLDAPVAENVSVEYQFFTYAAFSTDGRYLAATNDHGRYCAVWSVTHNTERDMDWENDAAAASGSADGYAGQPAAQCSPLSLSLVWVVALPTPQLGVRSRPYKVVACATSSFAFLQGSLVYVVHPDTRQADVRRCAVFTSLDDGLVGLCCSGFERDVLYVATSKAVFELRVNVKAGTGPIGAYPNGWSLREGCLAWLRSRPQALGLHGDRAVNFTTLRDQLAAAGIDMLTLAKYCPVGHPSVAVSLPRAGLDLLRSRASALICSVCRSERDVDVGWRLLCGMCGYSVCATCADRTVNPALEMLLGRVDPVVNDVD